MNFGRVKIQYFISVFCVTLFITMIIYHYITETENVFKKTHLKFPSHKLCILVPFRDRFEELLEFVPHMHSFLNNQSVNYQLFVVNQIDDLRFNRGSLINVGFLFVRNKTECDYISMHDVDLLPLNAELSYRYPSNGSYHVSAPYLHPLYHYNNFIGGILILKMDDFQNVNGISNKYWGWGLEDDEFYLRLKEASISIQRPRNLSSSIQHTFRHSHAGKKRKRDMTKCFNQKTATRKRDRQTGLHDVKYILKSVYSLSVNNVTSTVLNVALLCNQTMTPWCTCEPK